jgi:hypothetical protein
MMFFLTRMNMKMRQDKHKYGSPYLGLFSQANWEEVFAINGLHLIQSELDGIYDPYLLNDGSYPCRYLSEKSCHNQENTNEQ